VDAVIVVVFSVTVSALALAAFWVEYRLAKFELEQMEQESRDRHPAGRFCGPCGFAVEDWETHVKLQHRKRVPAPDDWV
jgi:hypothetical protein